jgi:two-component system response regulator YesN
MSYQHRILIVDDNETSLHLLSRSIQEVDHQYEVIMVEDGFAALVELYAHSFALMIAKYNLPQMDGLELARLAHRIAPGMRIALVTNHDLRDIRARAKRQHLKLDNYLHKPFTLMQLSCVIKGDNRFPN